MPILAPGVINTTAQEKIEEAVLLEYAAEQKWMNQGPIDRHRVVYESRVTVYLGEVYMLPSGSHFLTCDYGRDVAMLVDVRSGAEMDVCRDRDEYKWRNFRFAFDQEAQVVYCAAATWHIAEDL
jgi:hypothetical protein